jgi:hypothetical protein
MAFALARLLLGLVLGIGTGVVLSLLLIVPAAPPKRRHLPRHRLLQRGLPWRQHPGEAVRKGPWQRVSLASDVERDG